MRACCARARRPRDVLASRLLRQVAELLVAGLPLKSDAVESQKVNELLVRLMEVSQHPGGGARTQQGRR